MVPSRLRRCLRLYILDENCRSIALDFMGFDKVLEAIERKSQVYRVLLAAWGYMPVRAKTILLRLVNPSLTLGAVAVIAHQSSSMDDPQVLLGFHTYHVRAGTPWALLGGALKTRDASAHTATTDVPMEALIREVKEETNLDIAIRKLLAIDIDWHKSTMDFYFECSLPDESALALGVTLSPELERLAWFNVSQLPKDMFSQHRRFLTETLPHVEQLPAVPFVAR